MIRTILLDLDDVLNAFTMHILGQLGLDVRPYDFHKYPKDCGFDIIGAWVELSGNPKPTVPEFWEWIDRGMWASCPKSEQWWLLDVCASLVGKRNVLVATSPTKSSDCLAGKHDWIMRHLPVWAQRQYFITPRKQHLACDGMLLIDDSSANCHKFKYRKEGEKEVATGGLSITMPRPWNDCWHMTNDCDEYVANNLRSLFPDEVI